MMTMLSLCVLLFIVLGVKADTSYLQQDTSLPVSAIVGICVAGAIPVLILAVMCWLLAVRGVENCCSRRQNHEELPVAEAQMATPTAPPQSPAGTFAVAQV